MILRHLHPHPLLASRLLSRLSVDYQNAHSIIVSGGVSAIVGALIDSRDLRMHLQRSELHECLLHLTEHAQTHSFAFDTKLCKVLLEDRSRATQEAENREAAAILGSLSNLAGARLLDVDTDQIYSLLQLLQARLRAGAIQLPPLDCTSAIHKAYGETSACTSGLKRNRYFCKGAWLCAGKEQMIMRNMLVKLIFSLSKYKIAKSHWSHYSTAEKAYQATLSDMGYSGTHIAAPSVHCTCYGQLGSYFVSSERLASMT